MSRIMSRMQIIGGLLSVCLIGLNPTAAIAAETYTLSESVEKSQPLQITTAACSQHVDSQRQTACTDIRREIDRAEAQS